jgi:hypothetical protein
MPGYGPVQQWFCLVRISTRSEAAVIVLFHELGSPVDQAFLAASIARTVLEVEPAVLPGPAMSEPWPA